MTSRTIRGVGTLGRLLPYARRHAGQYAAGLTLTVLTAALGTLLPWFLRRAIEELGPPVDRPAILRLALVMVGVAAGVGALRYLMRELLNGVSRRVETDLRRDLFAACTARDAAWYARWRTGDLMARLTNDLGAVRMAAGPAVMYLVNTIAGGCFALVMMVRIDPRLTAAALLPMLGLPVLMIVLGRRVHARFEAVQAQFGELTARAQENLSGVRVVRAFRQERAELARFEAASEEYARRNVRLATLNGLMNPGFALLAGLGMAITIGYGGTLLVRGTIGVGAFVAFGIYLAQLTWPLIALGWTTNLFQRGAASMARLAEVLDAPSAPPPPPRRELPPPAPGGGRALAFDDVWFHYPVREGEAPRWVLRGVSFTLAPGQVLGVVGATGAGKSALVDLVPRLFDPQRGTITLDGVPLPALDPAQLRREIGHVPQETLLFSEPIGANVLYGVEGVADAWTPDEDEGPARAPPMPAAARAAAEVAQLSATVAALPDGWATRLGERGLTLSGGQKQRTAIARALARDPRVVLLDDALSAVDAHTEAAILHALRDALAGRTAIVVAHRVSAVREADRILVLEDGAVVESGTHDALVALGGRYAAMERRQALEAELAADD